MASKLIASTLRRILTKPISISCGITRQLSTATVSAVAPVFDSYKDQNGITMKGVKITGHHFYLDMQAMTPVDPRVLDSMLPYFISRYDNPHSRTHLYGWESDQAVETARSQVSDLIGASPKEIIFTSRATESNKISIKGVMHFYKDKKCHVITTHIFNTHQKRSKKQLF